MLLNVLNYTITIEKKKIDEAEQLSQYQAEKVVNEVLKNREKIIMEMYQYLR